MWGEGVQYLSHISEAKKRVIRSLLVFFAVFSVVWNYSDSIIEKLIELTDLKIITVSAFEMFLSEMYISLFVTLLIVMPYLGFELYKFISPGLFPKEKRIILWCSVPFYVMFLIGSIVPTIFFISVVMSILTQFYVAGVEQTVSLASYVSLVLSTSIAFGVLFCIPNVSGILTYLGVLNSSVMSKYRKHFIVVSMVFCAIITPGPDAASLILMELPVIFIYEGSIIISKIIECLCKKKN